MEKKKERRVKKIKEKKFVEIIYTPPPGAFCWCLKFSFLRAHPHFRPALNLQNLFVTYIFLLELGFIFSEGAVKILLCKKILGSNAWWGIQILIDPWWLVVYGKLEKIGFRGTSSLVKKKKLPPHSLPCKNPQGGCFLHLKIKKKRLYRAYEYVQNEN